MTKARRGAEEAKRSVKEKGKASLRGSPSSSLRTGLLLLLLLLALPLRCCPLLAPKLAHGRVVPLEHVHLLVVELDVLDLDLGARPGRGRPWERGLLKLGIGSHVQKRAGVSERR